jgi:dethiobiotin synthetase
VAPRGSGLFVVGTDTGVGKTVVTAALVHAFRAHGHETGVCKPVQSGQLADDPAGDAATLVRLGDVSATPSEVCVYAFAPPLAPLVAARREGRAVEVGPILERVRELQARFAALLVEGVGGLLVPLGEGLTVADLAVRLGFRLVVVARPGLGTVNHTALTVAVARARGLTVAGVVLNGYREKVDESVADNPALIAELAEVSVIGRTPWLDGELTASRIRARIAPAVDVAPLLAALESSG